MHMCKAKFGVFEIHFDAAIDTVSLDLCVYVFHP